MFTHRLALCCALLALPVMAADEHPQLGEPLSADQVDAVNYTVMPDGQGLPEGAGTAAKGKLIYEQHCAACHGAKGEGGLNDRLAGGLGTINSVKPVKTVGSYWPYATTLFDYIRRAMPFSAPGSLDNDDTYAVTAYVLHLNDIVDENDELNANTLPQVKMPNRDNFDSAWPLH
ncbi:MAG: cytochrome c [Woeseia sp.]